MYRYNFLKRAFSRGREAYIVGGAVRDILLGREPEDVDIAVSKEPYEYGKRLAESIGGRVITLGRNENIITKVISKRGIFDISVIRGGSIEEDLGLRDFTINGIALKIEDDSITDPFSGLNDIKNGKIRAVSESIFQKDPLRLIRAYRFAAFYNFHICEDTIGLIKRYKNLIIECSGERIKKEIFKIFDTPESYDYTIQMADSGLLFSIFPELTPLLHEDAPADTENGNNCFLQKRDPDIFAHTMRAYACLEAILNNRVRIPLHDFVFCPFSALCSNFTPRNSSGTSGAESFACRGDERNSLLCEGLLNMSFRMDEKNVPLLKLSILLHDIGKPYTKRIDSDRGVSFEGHDSKGAELAGEICRRLRTSSKEADYIGFIIKNHLEALYLFQKDRQALVGREDRIRFFIRCADKTPDLLLHTAADILGKNRMLSKHDEDFVRFGIRLYEDFKEDFLPVKSLPPLITGDDLMEIFSLKPSRLFGYILASVEEARLSRKISNKEEAVEMAEKIIRDVAD